MREPARTSSSKRPVPRTALALFAMCALPSAVAACGGDDDTPPAASAGGKSGASGSASTKGGAAGSAGTNAKGGSGGSLSAGNGGASAAGSAGTTSAGNGGAGGTGGGAGGATSGGSAGTTSGGTGGTSAGGSGLGGSGGAVIANDHPRIYQQPARKAALVAKLTAATPAAKRFRDMVDSEIAGTDHYAFAQWNASLLGTLLGDAKYCTHAVAKTDEWVTSEERLIAANQKAAVSGDSYLEVGDIIGSLAMVYDGCFASLTPAQKTRWTAYGNQAVYNVWHPNEAKWGTTTFTWSGWSIDNPFNNYHYSFLRATMLLGLATLGENPQAQGFIETFRQDKLPKLVAAFEKDLRGGGSREGTGYGVSHKSLFELYDFWEATTGERIWNLTSHTQASLAHLMHATVPTADRIAPIGDHARDSTAEFFDYHREQALVLQHLVGADPLGDVAQSFLEGVSVKQMGQFFEYVWDFLYADAAHAKAPLTKLSRTYYGPGTGYTFFRSSWDENATWGALIAGPYTESHAHRDQGSLLFYRNAWLAYDAQIDSHSGIRQEEELHNLVRLVQGGKTLRMQESKSPGQTTALADGDDLLHWAGKLDALYGKANVKRVEREVVFLKSLETFVVFDRIDGDDISSVFQINAPKAPVKNGAHWDVDAPSTGLEIYSLAPAAAPVTVFDWKASDPDDDLDAGFRLDIAGGAHTRYLTVLAAKGKVTAATGASAGGNTTATLTFAGGATGTVSFSDEGTGGSVKISGGGVTLDRPLAAGVVAPPVFVP